MMFLEFAVLPDRVDRPSPFRLPISRDEEDRLDEDLVINKDSAFEIFLYVSIIVIAFVPFVWVWVWVLFATNSRPAAARS
jgi:hypothetical protein